MTSKTLAAPGAGRSRSRRWLIAVGAVAVLIIVALYGVYRSGTPARGDDAGSSGFAYQVGQPGPGAMAPTFTLSATTGGQLNLASLRGKGVLLYFQEGLTCQPCWDQLTDLGKHGSALKAAGIDQVVSITTDPIDLITRKVHDMNLSTPVLSDPDLAVSNAYHATAFGMMGAARDGHTFILVRPDGTIAWRADYGGAPDYTMFVPTTALLNDLNHGRAA